MRIIRRRALAWLLCLALLSGAVCAAAEPAAASENETWNLRWSQEGELLTVEALDPLLPSCVPAELPGVEPASVSRLVVAAGVTALGERAFFGFSALRSVTLPKSLTSIGDEAFALPAGSAEQQLTLTLPKAAVLGRNVFSGRGSVLVLSENPAQKAALAGCRVSMRDTFRLLLVGNSYSEDAANCGQGMETSRLYTMLKNAWPEKEIEIGLLYSPGKSAAWFYDKAVRDEAAMSLRMIGGSRSEWTTVSSRMSLKQALNLTDWDAVTLQPYAAEQTGGVGGQGYDESVSYSYTLEESLGYLLHTVGVYAPAAKPFLYMCWSVGTGAERLNEGAEEFALRVKTMLETKYVGKVREQMGAGGWRETGESFAAVIPCGTAIQNARCTYLGLLRYHVGATPVDLANDPVEGLLRDGNHVSFNVGRYLLALTFARVLTGTAAEKLCQNVPLNYGTPVGPLPEDYLKRIAAAADAAVADPTHISDPSLQDDTDPARLAANGLEGAKIAIPACGPDMTETLRANLTARLEEARKTWSELELTNVECPVPYGTNNNLWSSTATLRFGYTELTIRVGGRLTEHEWRDWVTLRPATATEPGLETRVCAHCGAAEQRSVAPRSWDVNGDGEVTAEDAARLFRSLSAGGETAPDADGDGKQNNRDALRIFRFAAGKLAA